MYLKFYKGLIYFINNINNYNSYKIIAAIVFCIMIFLLRNLVIYLERKF